MKAEEFHVLLGHRPEATVALGGAGDRSAAALVADACAVGSRLPRPTPGSHVGLICADRYHFAAGLLGAWQAGHAVALPSNGRPATVAALRSRPEVCALLHDGGREQESDGAQDLLVGQDIRAWLASPHLQDVGPEQLNALPAGRHVATVFTSGSTGDPLPCPKTAAQLLGEATAHVAALQLQPGQPVVATVPSYHLYGLLFSVLVPLLGGGAFLRDTPLHAPTLGALLADLRDVLVVSVPAHLASWVLLEPGALGSVRTLVTSTAPLPDSVAEMLRERHGLVPLEVFGSSETGGIATRRRDRTADWQALGGVTIGADSEGRLLVTSPFVDPALPQPLRTGDRIELTSSHTFRHLGRSDGVIKTGGQRVALSAVEARLLALPGVVDAAVVAIPSQQALRAVELVAAVVAPGVSAATLRAGLAQWFEPSVLPRRYVLCDALPREATGKLPRDRLLQWLAQRAEGQVTNPSDLRPRTLEILARRTDGPDRAEFDLRVPENLWYFAGHFPGHPVLPGVAELCVGVLPCVAELRPTWQHLRKVSRLKFRRLIRPGDRLRLSLVLGPAWAEFELSRDLAGQADLCASGKLFWEHA